LADGDARRLVTGVIPISAELANGLANFIGGSVRFWLSRQAQYQSDLLWVGADRLAERVPLRDMVRLGWVDRVPDSWKDRAELCLGYFGVSDVEEWNQRWGTRLSEARFRTSGAFPLEDAAVAAWLRQAEIVAARIEVAEWSPRHLRDALSDFRRLTKARPEQFVRRLQELCSAAGLAVVILKTPAGCALNGAAFVTPAGKRVIALSARDLADDRFWFTFFHELGHMLLHVADGIILDDFDEEASEDATELEANDFAQRTLVPFELGPLTGSRAAGSVMRQIVAIASELDVAPGIVVGQLQHLGYIGFDSQNRLKRRYAWRGNELASA
jgi:hypothetical protein